MRIFLLAFALVAVTACQSETEQTSAQILDPIIEKQEAMLKDCGENGGVSTIGGHGQMICIFPAKDAGKSCSSSRDCDGVCLAEGQVCSPEAPYYGCHDVYENGTIATLCVD